MLTDERKDPYRIRIPVIWDELDEIKNRLERLESRNEIHHEYWEIRTLTELDTLLASCRKELENHGIIRLSLEKHAQ